MILDTLQLSKDLQPAFDPEQAEALSRALASVSASGDHATKTDLATLRIEIKAELATVKADVSTVKADIATVKADIATQLAAFKVDVIRWIVGAIAFNVLATAGLIIALVRTLVH